LCVHFYFLTAYLWCIRPMCCFTDECQN